MNRNSLYILACILFAVSFANYAYGVTGTMVVAIATIFGAFMAINIGANDVANNLGATVGANAITITIAIIIAAIFEFAGAMIAGGDVVSTIKKGIINPAIIQDTTMFVNAMMAALLSAALWLTLATWKGLPVSTTHSIVGGVMGAGIALGGFDIVNWSKMGSIAASWIISPLVGGIIAAGILFFIRRKITLKEDKITAAKTWVPILISAMTLIFVTYLILKGLKNIWPNIINGINIVSPYTFEVTKNPTLFAAILIASVISILVYFFINPIIKKRADGIENNKEGIYKLFTEAVIISAAALCFAHGSNDVANAVGPLAAIVDSMSSGNINNKASIPLWVMLVGSSGLVVGLILYGPKLIKKVGHGIVRLTILKAFAVNMSSAFTVVIASQLGMPVSSTHIAIGAIFGVGFLHEFMDRHNNALKKLQKRLIISKEALEQLKTLREELDSEYLEIGNQIDQIKNDYVLFENEIKTKGENYEMSLEELNKDRIINTKLKILYRKQKKISNKKGEVCRDISESINDLHERELKLSRYTKKEFIERSYVRNIAAAWIITVPASAIMSGLIFIFIVGFNNLYR
jgi:PiT family inorganic phosphate transporter